MDSFASIAKAKMTAKLLKSKVQLKRQEKLSTVDMMAAMREADEYEAAEEKQDTTIGPLETKANEKFRHSTSP
ncbi:hypothetical protein ScalyP_jg1404 [Parmales sp. scaly parma]|nr:hypothetical protein ScalyP_jg1404 [Parmales sp. scaly parma]